MANNEQQLELEVEVDFTLVARRIVSDDPELREQLLSLRRRNSYLAEPEQAGVYDELREWMEKLAPKVQAVFGEEEDLGDEFADLEYNVLDGRQFRLYPTKKK